MRKIIILRKSFSFYFLLSFSLFFIEKALLFLPNDILWSQCKLSISSFDFALFVSNKLRYIIKRKYLLVKETILKLLKNYQPINVNLYFLEMFLKIPNGVKTFHKKYSKLVLILAIPLVASLIPIILPNKVSRS